MFINHNKILDREREREKREKENERELNTNNFLTDFKKRGGSPFDNFFLFVTLQISTG